MHQASRFCFQNWYLMDAIDVDIRGSTALVGPTGAGKSSFQDGIQTLMTGNNHNRLNLNPSASGKSARSVFDYCLGWTKDPTEGGKPLRESCESLIATVFEDSVTKVPFTVGIVLSARLGDTREEVLSRFIAPGYAYSVNEARRRVGNRETLAPWSEVVEIIRSKCPEFEEFKTSAEKFTGEMLRRMRTDGQPPNPKHFLRAFHNALAFKPIFDPTQFVRDFILEQDDLDIDRVRTSIGTWQELERLIEEVEAKLRRVTRMSERFRSWGRAKVRAEAARFTSAVAELRRLGHDVRTFKDQVGYRTENLVNERNVLVTRKQWVEELNEEIRTKSILASTSGESAYLRQLEVESQHTQKELQATVLRVQRIKAALSEIASLAPIKNAVSPRQARAIDAAREAANLLNEGMDPSALLKGKGERLQALVDEVVAIESLEVLMHEKADQLANEVRILQHHVDEMDTRLGSGAKQALLSSTTTRLMGALERKGMNPIPVCDVVDVIDEAWRDAVEGLLGRAREAIIVAPDRLEEAWDYMLSDQDAFSGCNLVETTAASRARNTLEKGSIFEVLSTDNEYAEAFVKTRIGGFIKANNEEEMARLDRGVMKNGKTKSGMALSVAQKVRTHMLGSAARETSTETLRNELADKRAALRTKSESVRILREAAKIIPGAIGILKDGDGPFLLELSLKSLSKQLADLLQNQKTAVSGDASASQLLEDIEYATEQLKIYQAEIKDELEPNVFKLQQEVATATAKLEASIEGFRKAFRDRQKAWASLSSPDVQKLLAYDPEIDEPNAVKLLHQVRSDLKRREAERTDLKAFLSGVRNEQKGIADTYDSEARREQSQAIRDITEYSVAWNTDVPQIDHETMTVGYAWVMGEKARLEGNELRKHQKDCERAANEMRKLLKEDLLARLAEKLVKVRHKLEHLNQRLSRHHFTGQVYTFTWSVNARFQRMHDLAMKVAEATDDTAINLEASEIAEAVQELEGLIQGNEGTQKLADYREYFMFEIIMTDSNGARTSMSTRAVKGSGGEAQAPFYVAMAASLSSAYFPGHVMGEPTGMGLAMFDEAFNKLDVPNTQALLTFFKDMGLQLMIAGPEDKRATFTEVLDTIILVNKHPDGTSVYIDPEYPGDLARLALGSINPDHGGIDAFRKAS